MPLQNCVCSRMSNLPSTQKASSFLLVSLHSSLSQKAFTCSCYRSPRQMFDFIPVFSWGYRWISLSVLTMTLSSKVAGTLRARSLSAINSAPVVWERLIISGKSLNQLNKIIAISVFPPTVNWPRFSPVLCYPSTTVSDGCHSVNGQIAWLRMCSSVVFKQIHRDAASVLFF